jgi:hypothetical protein
MDNKPHTIYKSIFTKPKAMWFKMNGKEKTVKTLNMMAWITTF